MTTIVIISLLAAGVAFVLAISTFEENKKRDEAEQKRIERENKREEAKLDKFMAEMEQQKNEYIKLNEELDAQFGTCTWRVPFKESGTPGSLRIYDECRIIVLDHVKIIRYSEIKTCSVVPSVTMKPKLVLRRDNSQTILKTDTSNMIGRAVVGGLIAGPVGAIIGGATAKKREETMGNYVSSIELRPDGCDVQIDFVDGSEPYRMSCGGDDSRARRISDNINTIINTGSFNPEDH